MSVHLLAAAHVRQHVGVSVWDPVKSGEVEVFVFRQGGREILFSRDGQSFARGTERLVVAKLPEAPLYFRILSGVETTCDRLSMRIEPMHLFRAWMEKTGGTVSLRDEDRFDLLVEWVCDLMQNREPRSAEIAGQAAQLALSSLIRPPFAPSSRQSRPAQPLPDVVKRALVVMHQLLPREDKPAGRIRSIAQICGVSERTLRRLFISSLGSSPLACLGRIQIRLSARMLRSTDLPLKEVARLNGFNEEFHFSKRFKAAYGVPPGAFRSRRDIRIEAVNDPQAGFGEDPNLIQQGIREIDLQNRPKPATKRP